MEEEKQSNSPPLIIGKLGEAPAPFEFSQMEFENSSAEFAAAEAHARGKGKLPGGREHGVEGRPGGDSVCQLASHIAATMRRLMHS